MPAASWLQTARDFPLGGLELNVQSRKGSRSSHLHLPTIAPVIVRVLNCNQLFPGSLNLYAEVPVEFPAPAIVRCGGADWQFVPVIVSEAAVGVAARRPPPDTSEFIEVFACHRLSEKLGLTYDTMLQIRLMPGLHLDFAVTGA